MTIFRKILWCCICALFFLIGFSLSAQNAFVENKGQYPERVKSKVALPSGTLFIEEAKLVYAFYSSEQLKINQQIKATQQKGYEANLKSRKARGDFISDVSGSGLAMSGSTERLMADYYRTEGNFNSARQRNLGINIAQYERNLEAIQFGQQAQSTYVAPPNPALLFASASLEKTRID